MQINAQCPAGAVGTTGNIAPDDGTTAVVSSNAGEQTCFDVEIGATYTFSTIGNTGDDTQITVFEPAGTAVAFSDDAGGTLQSEAVYVATTTEICIQVESFNCLGTGSVSTSYDVTSSCTPPIPTCPDGSEIIVQEGFDACALPAGWSVSATDGGTGDITFTETDGAGPGAPGPNLDFSGCHATIDDDANDGIGVGCIITNEIDLSMCDPGSPITVDVDYTNGDFAGTGDFLVDVSGDGGATWTNVFIEMEDNTGTFNGDVSAIAPGGGTIVVRFCYDDEGAFAWGAAIDNVTICHVPIEDCEPTIGTPTIGN